jgi:exopolysaccharide production protein ExoZ
VKLHHLQALRGIAANLVVLDHIFSALIKYGHMPQRFEAASWHLGEMGVGIFFVISGFIMIYTAHEEAGKPGAVALFLEKRIVRVVPLYWLATLLTFAMLFAIHKPESLGNLVRSLLFIPYDSGSPPEIRPVLGQGWTINYEMFFYAIFALSLFLKPPRSLWFLLAMFAALFLSGRLVEGDHGAAFATYTDPLILLFLAGVLIGWVRVRWAGEIPVRRPLLLASAVIVANEALFYSVAEPGIAIVLGCTALSILTVILCTFAPEGRDGPVARAWERLGDGSYSTYLFHTLLLAALNRALLGHGQAFVPTLYGVLALVGANVVGIAFFFLLERPMTRQLRRAIHAARRTAILSN